MVSANTYYTNANEEGSYGYVKSTSIDPDTNSTHDGAWVAYEYYPWAEDSAGTVSRVHRPYGNSPASVPTDLAASNSGEITSYEYVEDAFGRKSRPSLVETKVNGVTVSKSTTDYTDTATVNDMYIVEAAQKDYSSSSVYLETVTKYYREDTWLQFFRNQVHSVTDPTGTRRSYVYQRGTWEGGGSFTTSGTGFNSSGNPSGPASRTIEFIGSKANQGEGQQTTYDGYDIEDVYLISGKSLMNITIRDKYARVVRTESRVWNGDGSAWVPLASTNYGYNGSNQLNSVSHSNNSSSSATYAGELMTGQTDEAGVSLTYTHDNGGRIRDVTQAAQGAIGALVTRYSYDATGQILTKTVGQGQSETLVTTLTYDDAGRPSSKLLPGQNTATTYTYDPANRKRTTTFSNGGTRVEEFNHDRTPAKTTGTGVVEEHYTYSIENNQRKTIARSGTSSSTRTVTAWHDWLGRPVKTQRPGFAPSGLSAYTQNFSYNSTTGLLSSIARSAGLATVYYTYDALGNRLTEGLDIDGGGITTGGTDRITGTERKFVNNKPSSTDWWLFTRTYTYGTASSPAEHTLSTSYERITGFSSTLRSEVESTNGDGRTSTRTIDVVPSTKSATLTSMLDGLNNSTVTLTNGFKTSEVGSDALTTSYAYDSLHRPSKVTDSRGIETTTTYWSGSTLPHYIKDGSGATVATHTYNSAGQCTLTQNAYSKTTRYAYDTRGQLYRQWGSGTHPVEVGYNTYGQRNSLKTYRGAPSTDSSTWPSVGTADTTQWTYDDASGLLHYKTTPDGNSVVLGYDAAGRITSREWVRRDPGNTSQGVKTDYAYTASTGELSSVTYHDNGTTVTSYTYTRLGQPATVTDATGTRTFNYDSAKPWRLTSEALPSFFGSRVITRLYETSNATGRYRGFQLGTSGNPDADLEQTYTISAQARFTDLSSKRADNGVSRTFSYGYYDSANNKDTRLVHSLSLSGSHPFSITRTYASNLDLLESIDSKWSTASRTKFTYAYDSRHLRDTVVQSGSVFTDADNYGDDLHQNFDYNDRGELTAAASYQGSTANSTSNPLPGRHFVYDYDSIGNRNWSNNTGVTYDPNATEPLTQPDLYTHNQLNQVTARENKAINVSGVADANAPVLIDDNTALAARQDRYWSDQIWPDNTTGPANPTITVRAAKPGAGSGGADLINKQLITLLYPAAQQTYTYDLDGNLTGDGLFNYNWDAENRLTSVTTNSVAISAGAENVTITFKYDYLGRRVEKVVSNSTDLNKSYQHRYIYDGWDLIAEIDVSNNTVRRSFTWGLDLVGSLTSSGGVGALLQIHDNAQSKTLLPTYDGNGNVVSLLNADSGAIEAIYEYSPFGELIRAEGDYADDNPFRFSSKFQDNETKLIYYGYRYYNARNGRFINRDPIAEAGGLNLYGFVGNDGVNGWDYLGMDGELPPVVINVPRLSSPPSLNFYLARLGGFAMAGAQRGGYQRLGEVGPEVVKLLPVVVSASSYSPTNPDVFAPWNYTRVVDVEGVLGWSKVGDYGQLVTLPTYTVSESRHTTSQAPSIWAGAAGAAFGGARSFFRGLLWEGPKEMVTGLYTLVTTNPITTVTNFADDLGTLAGELVYNTEETLTGMGRALTDPEQIGKATFGALTSLASGALVGKVAAAEKSIGGAKPFAMGIENHLDDFARQHAASTWKDFDDVVNWKPQVLDKLTDPNQRVLFNLDNVEVFRGAQRAAAGGRGGTDWELLQIMQNPNFPNLEFWQAGKQVPNPFQ